MEQRIKIPKPFGDIFEPYRYKVFYGGRGSGKSWSVAIALLLIGLKQKTRVVCAREYQNSIEESVHKLLSDLINTYNMPYSVDKYRIYCDNGSEFIFKGLSKGDAASIKSMEGADICWVEEAQNVTEASWKNLIPTIRKDGSEIWVTFNPDIEGSPTYQRFVANPPPNSLVRKVNWDANPFFPDVLEQERLHMLATDPVSYKNVWDGEPRTFSEGAYFREQMEGLEKDGRIGDVPYNRAKNVYTFWDLGWDDSTAIWFVQEGDGDACHMIDYWEGSNFDLPSIVDEVINKKPYRYGKHIIPHDGGYGNRQTGKTDRDILQDLGLSVEVQERTNDKRGDVNTLRLFIPRMRIDKEKCSQGIASLRAYRQEQDPKTGLWHFKHDWSSHGVDAARYCAVGFDKVARRSQAVDISHLFTHRPIMR